MIGKLDIAIVGYGIAGIAAAIGLRRLGHRVEHFERAGSANRGGAGLLLQPPALKLLQDLGLDANAFPCAATVSGLAAERVDGKPLLRIRYADQAPGCHALGIQRHYLVERMGELDEGRDRLHLASPVHGIDAERGILHFAAAPARGPYDLVIAADGSNSRLRRDVPHLVRRDRRYPTAAIVACLDDPEGLTGDRLVQYFDRGRHVAVWPIGAAREDAPGQANVSINCTCGNAGSFRASGEWKQVFLQHCPHLASLLDRCGREVESFVYRYRDVELYRPYFGKVVFIGDAAHSMSPVLGQGARLGLLDAAVLSRTLSVCANVADALDDFARECRSGLRSVQRANRWLTPVFQSEARVFAGLREVLQQAHRLPFIAARARALLAGA